MKYVCLMLTLKHKLNFFTAYHMLLTSIATEFERDTSVSLLIVTSLGAALFNL